MTLEVYVRLLDESVDVWRPVPATPSKKSDWFVLGTPHDYSPKTENLEFKLGTEVRCERRKLEDREQLVAVEAFQR